MVSRQTRETALLVAVGIVGFVTVQSLGAPEVIGAVILIAFGAVGPVVRDEWRGRQEG